MATINLINALYSYSYHLFAVIYKRMLPKNKTTTHLSIKSISESKSFSLSKPFTPLPSKSAFAFITTRAATILGES